MQKKKCHFGGRKLRVSSSDVFYVLNEIENAHGVDCVGNQI